MDGADSYQFNTSDGQGDFEVDGKVVLTNASIHKGQVIFDDNSGTDSILAVGNSCNTGLNVQSSDIVMCTIVGYVPGVHGYSSLSMNDMISVTAYTGYFIIQRRSGGTPYLKVNWQKL